MDNFSILNKRDSIEINLVVHSKFDVFPIFVCNKRMNIQKLQKFLAARGCEN